MTTAHFTFGQSHMSNYPLPHGGRLADYWVTVTLPDGSEMHPREVFIREFTERHCPRPEQFAFEYSEDGLKPEYFPGGCLCTITEKGMQE